MTNYKLALMGFGNVGQALGKLLQRKEAELKDEYDITISVVAITTGSHGSAIDAAGLDLDKALAIAEASGMFDELSAAPSPTDKLDWIKASGADVLFENSPVSYADGQPAIDHMRTALNNGMHVFTANKGPVVHAHAELTALAEKVGRKFYFESTVMDGAPVFGLIRATLPTAKVTALTGVLNSTTNLILSKMEDGESFDDAVKYAQSIGIAETDPSGDVDGWDAAIKVSALVTVVMGERLTPDMMDVTGIGDISPADIESAREQGKRWKLVCRAEKTADGVKAKVAPEMVGPDTPLYTVDGTTSIVQFESDVLGKLSLIEDNPSPMTTAYGLLTDFINGVTE